MKQEKEMAKAMSKKECWYCGTWYSGKACPQCKTVDDEPKQKWNGRIKK